MLTYVRPEEVNDKYSRSIILLENHPIYCLGVNPNSVFKMSYYYIGDPNNKLDIGLQDARLTDGPFNLGYINSVPCVNDLGEPVEQVSFCSRIPVRKWKQGLTPENLYFQGKSLVYNKACSLKTFSDMIRGIYPSYQLIKNKLGDKPGCIAFHRHWALGIGKLEQVELFHRGQLVGQGEDFDRVKLAPKFSFLQEKLEESKQ